MINCANFSQLFFIEYIFKDLSDEKFIIFQYIYKDNLNYSKPETCSKNTLSFKAIKKSIEIIKGHKIVQNKAY